MNGCLLKLKLITNLHAGNGDVNYNIIDNEVERDVTTGLPTINSSGVKGAFREFFEKNGADQSTLESLFGAGKRQGSLKFLSADLLGLAVRASSGPVPFYLVSDEKNLLLAEQKITALGLSLNKGTTEAVSGCAADGYDLSKKTKIAGDEIYLFDSAEDLRKISLPVIARNCLDDGGISKNLWYEEVVPHQSVFTVAVLSDNAEDLAKFREKVNEKFIQFGGNASIGYGICKVTVIF